MSGMRETALAIVLTSWTTCAISGTCRTGTGTYYAGRSQPPLLAEMVSLLDDDALTAEAAPLIEIELSWWSGRRASAVKGLARYGSGKRSRGPSPI